MTRERWADPRTMDPVGWRRLIHETPLSPSLQGMVDETNLLFEECQRTGGHVKSGRTVMRFLGGTQMEMWVCAHCGVPQHGAGRRSPYAPQW